MDEGRAMLTAQPEVLFTYPSPMGDHNKIGRLSLQDGVGRLTRFSPRDDPVQLPSSTSVAIQLPRPDRQAAGVTTLGPDGCFLYFDVALSSSCGFFRATVLLARTAMEQSGLKRWSVDELAVLYTLQAGVPARLGLRLTASWCNVMGLFGSTLVADKLSSLTGFVYNKRQVARAMLLLRNHTDSVRSDRHSRFVGHGVMWVMPGAPSADTEDVEVPGVADADTVGESISEHLRNTAVERCAHCQSDRAWRKAKSLITQRRSPHQMQFAKIW